jgi:hypothetical protein
VTREKRRPTAGLALATSVLACWRVSHLVAYEDGPFDIVLKARARAGPSVWGRLMDCPYCLSIWVAAPLAGWTVRRAGLGPRDGVAVWLAISGGASLLERVTAAGEVATPAAPVQTEGRT